MEILLKRKKFLADRTIGELTINGMFKCYTLEDTVRPEGVKIPGETAIPAGTYTVIVTRSPTFKRSLPLLLNVPGFAGVRIHGGNTPEHTRGCILVAHHFNELTNEIYDSAADAITDILSTAATSSITIINEKEKV